MNGKNFFLPVICLCTVFLGCTKSTTTTTDESGNWIKKSEFEGVARAEAVSFVIDNKAYITTGYDGTKRLKDLWQYDVDLNFWTQKADFAGSARNSAIAFSIGSKGYVGTGYDGTDKLKDFYEYDPVKNAWARKMDFAGSARYDAVGFGIMDKGYVSTGFDGNYLKDFWSYNPSSDSWTQEVSMGGSKRSAAVSFVYDNKAYITAGSNNGTTVNDLWMYDPSNSSWTEKRKISNVSDDSYDDSYTIVRNNGVALIIADKAYISTGDNGSFLKTTWEYDFTNDVWMAKSAFEGVERNGAVGFTINGRGFIATGKNSTYYFDDIYEFKPNETLNTND
jgi:N-acetylneuraminic acid mutarotase